MNNVNKTLYIPLYGKAYVSKKGILLCDPKAEQIWQAEGFALKGKSKSKWLAYYMAMRARVFDRWLEKQMEADPDVVVLHIGCGMDSRISRVGDRGHLWFDIDFPEVIAERKRFYAETDSYQMLGADIRSETWLDQIPKNRAIVVMEGVSMYLRPEDLEAVLKRIAGCFPSVQLLMDCYTTFAAKASRFKNPINDVGVTEVYGLDEPTVLESSGMRFLREHEMTPEDLIEELQGVENTMFKKLYAGNVAKKMYRLYEYGRDNHEI